MNAKKILAGVTVAAAMLIGATPANAAPVAWTGYEDTQFGNETDGIFWSFYPNGALDHSKIWIAGSEWDSMVCSDDEGLRVDGNTMAYNDADFTYEDLDNGDRVIKGPGEYTTGNGDVVDVAVEHRIFADKDFTRFGYTFTNNNSTAVTFQVSTFVDPDHNYGVAASTSDGNDVVNTSDNWWVDFSESSQSVVYMQVMGTPGAFGIDSVDPIDLVQGDDGWVTYDSITIEPGESFQWIYFYYMGTYNFNEGGDQVAWDANTASGRAAAASAREEFGSEFTISERLAAGLDTSIPSNWEYTPADNGGSSLAATGQNATLNLMVGAGAAVLLIGGAVVLATTRRRKNNG